MLLKCGDKVGSTRKEEEKIEKGTRGHYGSIIYSKGMFKTIW